MACSKRYSKKFQSFTDINANWNGSSCNFSFQYGTLLQGILKFHGNSMQFEMAPHVTFPFQYGGATLVSSPDCLIFLCVLFWWANVSDIYLRLFVVDVADMVMVLRCYYVSFLVSNIWSLHACHLDYKEHTLYQNGNIRNSVWNKGNYLCTCWCSCMHIKWWSYSYD